MRDQWGTGPCMGVPGFVPHALPHVPLTVEGSRAAGLQGCQCFAGGALAC